MALASVTYSGNGTTLSFPIPFAYTDPMTLTVLLEGVPTTSGFIVSGGSVVFAIAPLSGVVVTIKRITNKATQAVMFHDASVLTASDLTANSTQLFNLLQEQDDVAGNALGKSYDGVYDAAGSRIKNLGTPTAPRDAVTKDYVDPIVAAASASASSASSAASTANVAAGIAQRAATIAQQAISSEYYADNAGTSDGISVSYPAAPPTLFDGYRLTVGITTPNTSTTPTIAVTLGGTTQPLRSFVKSNGAAWVPLVAGDLHGDADIRYDLPNTRWILMNPATVLRAETAAALSSFTGTDFRYALLNGSYLIDFAVKKLIQINDLSAGSGISSQNSANNTGGAFHQFLNYVGTVCGSISQPTATTTAYNTASDYRLKTNVLPMTGALDRVRLLKPCTYTWLSDGVDAEGFIAHELQGVIPVAVTGSKDAEDKCGNPIYQSMDATFVVPLLTAAIQELSEAFSAYKLSHP